MKRMWAQFVPETTLERNLAIQCILSAFGTGSFLTGTAVFFTQVVGLTGSQIGLGLSISAAVALLLQMPMGRLADRMGAQRLWVLASAVEAAAYFLWPFIASMAAFVLMLSTLALFESAARNARNVYRLQVFAPAQRVRANAYMRAARNVGYTLGAAAAGIALGLHSHAALVAMPVVTGLLLVVNAVMIKVVLPPVAAPAPARDDDPLHASSAAWRNRGFVTLAACNGVLASNQVLLNVVVPLWLVERTDAPRTLLAWLFGTNTVMAVALQMRASRGSDSVAGSLRATRLAGAAFVVSCAVLAVTHHTMGLVSILLIWLGHVTITGAELWQSAADWGFTAALSDPRRLGDYQGVWGMGYQLGAVVFPALYTYLALQWGTPGWVLIAAVSVVAAAAARPASRAAERYLARSGAPA